MFKYIDYKFNNDAETFEDIFSTNTSATATDFKKCYINLVISTYASQINKEERTRGKNTVIGRFTCTKCHFGTDHRNDYTKHLNSDHHNRFILNEQSLCELVGINYNENSDIGLSLQQSTKFFDKFNLSLIAVDIMANKISEHINESSRHIIPSTLYILVHSNHVYKLMCSNEKSYIKILNSVHQNKELLRLNNVPNKYNFKDFSKQRNQKLIVIYDLNDVVENIKQNPGISIRFVTQTSLTKILFNMVDQKYIPQVNFENRRLSSIKFKIDKIVYTIQIPCNFQDTDHTIEIGKIETFEEANETFYNWIVNKNFISKQSDQVKIVEDAYRNTPLSGYFKNYYDIKLIEINHMHHC